MINDNVGQKKPMCRTVPANNMKKILLFLSNWTISFIHQNIMTTKNMKKEWCLNRVIGEIIVNEVKKRTAATIDHSLS